tara:strand:+ start:1108 stop:1323 length:216 start_codon:yes stop_codon:yes gene_type:complete
MGEQDAAIEKSGTALVADVADEADQDFIFKGPDHLVTSRYVSALLSLQANLPLVKSIASNIRIRAPPLSTC